MKTMKYAWKKALNRNQVYLSPTYLTNGHFAVKREALPVKIAPMAKNIDTLNGALSVDDVLEKTDAFIENVVDGVNSKQWLVTDVIAHGGVVLVPASPVDNQNGLRFLDPEYTALLGVEPGDKLYSDVKGERFTDKDDSAGDWVLMARKGGDNDLAIIGAVLNFKKANDGSKV